MSNPAAAEINADQIDSKQILEAIVDAQPGHLKAASEASSNMIRRKLREKNPSDEIPAESLRGYSPTQFARLFGKHATWAYRLLYSGRIKKIDYPGSILIPESEVKKFMSKTTNHQ